MYSEPTETSKMELFGEIVHSFLFLIVFAKHSILDVSHGSDTPMNLIAIVRKSRSVNLTERKQDFQKPFMTEAVLI